MFEKLDCSIINFLLDNTPVEETIEDAQIYLDFILNPDYVFNNYINYDLINYERLFYIEYLFGNNEKIKKKLEKIKEEVGTNYLMKQKYLKRIYNKIPNLDNLHRENHFGRYNLPSEYESYVDFSKDKEEM